MLCHGNICRSPYVEGILKSKLSPINFCVYSAGTKDFHIGKTPDYRSIKIVDKHGIEISLKKPEYLKLKVLIFLIRFKLCIEII